MEHHAILAHTISRHRAKDCSFTVAYLLDTIAVWLVVGCFVVMYFILVARHELE